ncbi:MAG: hypothetical protein HUJ63_13070 [Enterococcus sp.]|nr:hypothetical protein [Enterococcus sp.]
MTGESMRVTEAPGIERLSSRYGEKAKDAAAVLADEVVPFAGLVPAVRRRVDARLQRAQEEWYAGLPDERRARFDRLLEPGLWDPKAREFEWGKFRDMPGFVPAGRNSAWMHMLPAMFGGPRAVTRKFMGTAKGFVKKAAGKVYKGGLLLPEARSVAAIEKQAAKTATRMTEVGEELANAEKGIATAESLMTRDELGLMAENAAAAGDAKTAAELIAKSTDSSVLKSAAQRDAVIRNASNRKRWLTREQTVLQGRATALEDMKMAAEAKAGDAKILSDALSGASVDTAKFNTRLNRATALVSDFASNHPGWFWGTVMVGSGAAATWYAATRKQDAAEAASELAAQRENDAATLAWRKRVHEDPKLVAATSDAGYIANEIQSILGAVHAEAVRRTKDVADPAARRKAYNDVLIKMLKDDPGARRTAEEAASGVGEPFAPTYGNWYMSLMRLVNTEQIRGLALARSERMAGELVANGAVQPGDEAGLKRALAKVDAESNPLERMTGLVLPPEYSVLGRMVDERIKIDAAVGDGRNGK